MAGFDCPAGAIAVAAASWAWNHRDIAEPDGKAMLKFVLDVLPESATKAGIQKVCELPFEYSVATVASIVGNGTMVSSQDTVPLALWCAARLFGLVSAAQVFDAISFYLDNQAEIDGYIDWYHSRPPLNIPAELRLNPLRDEVNQAIQTDRQASAPADPVHH